MPTEALARLRIPGLPARLQLYIHGAQDRHVSRRIREEGIWEPYETALVMALLPPAGVFVDVGANIGYFSLLAAAWMGPQGRVFAFEPDPENYRLLQASAAENGLESRIHAVRAGLSDGDGEGRLYLSADNLGDHQLFPGDGDRPSVRVRLLEGSRFLAAHGARIDLLKIDTQGSEYQVIAGLLPLLQTLSRAPRILIELTPLSLRQAGSSGRALIEALALLDQPMWIIDHLEHALVASSAPELARWCDEVDAVPGDAGFMNILVGAGP